MGSGISRDGQVIISGGGKGELIAWDGVTGESLIEAITAHSWSIFSLDFSPNSEVLATGSRDKTTKFWCTKTWKQQGNPIACDAVVYCVRYSPDGNLLAIATSRDIQICNPRTGDCIANFCSLADNMSLAWTPNGRQLLSAGSGSDSTIRGWDSLNWKQIDHPWSGHTSLINAITINSAGTLVASASHDNHVRLWRLSDRRTIYVFKHSGAVCSVTFSADGKHILSGGYDKKVLEWKVPEDALSGDVPIELPLDVAIEPNPSSYLGYEEKRAALHRAKRYDEAIETFQNMLLKLEHSPDIQTRELRQQYVDRSEVEVAIRKIIDVQLENAPLRLLDTYSGYLCDQNAQISAFKASTEYKELVSSTTKRADLQGERIKHVVASYFQYVTLSHRWGKELRLQDIQEKNVYKMNRADGVVKLQSFCKASHDARYRWAWSDTCCIDKSDGAEVSKSVNSMFTWYHHSALTIVYLSDVSKPGELEQSEWNERGWTFQELVAPKVVRFYQKDWTIYRNDLTPNHKHSDAIMEELREATGIDSRALVAFRPG
ncbi:quinon protein alcohol dehydrogenase-like superfamily, partial [Suillus spraguei]